MRVKAGAPSWTVRSGAKRTNDKVTAPPIRGVSNGLCEYLRACEGCIYFLRARAVVTFVLRAVSTSENTDDEQRALCKFSAGRNLSLTEETFFFGAIWLTLPKQDNGHIYGSTNPSQ